MVRGNLIVPGSFATAANAMSAAGSKPAGGILRHKGWRAAKVDLPALSAKQDAAIIAPAEIEIE
jgi:hypothetical protein